MLFILCEALWLLATGLFSCFVVFLLLHFAGPIWPYDQLAGEAGAGCLVFHWLMTCVVVC